MTATLNERMSMYENISDIQLAPRLPIIVSLNGRCFRKATSLIEKPYSKSFSDIMCKVMITLASEVSGTSFVYSYNDHIVMVIQNDKSHETEMWCDNRIQKIISICTSLSSVVFYSLTKEYNIEIVGNPTFVGKTFILPSPTEAINYLIDQQHQASHSAISMACFYELLKKYSADKVLKIVKNLTIEDKYDLLTKECDVDLQSFPLSFWRGIACYRTPKLVKTVLGEEMKNKLTIDDELPFFNKDQLFLANLLKKQ